MKPRRTLKLLDSRRPELESCSYCPKLCRAACPVAEAEASDTVTPWGIMSANYEVGLGRLPADEEFAALSWACTGCNGCRSRCDLENPVPETLFDARAEYSQRGLEPPVVRQYRAGFSARRMRQRERVEALRQRFGHRANAATALLIGCSYLDRSSAETEDALVAARALFGEFRLLAGCCGLPLRVAGAATQAASEHEALAAEAAGAERVIAVDAGCAHATSEFSVPFARAAAQALLARGTKSTLRGRSLRYHDPCWLGRGLGEYDAPREILARALGQPVAEFARSRAAARCSGAGALLPKTRPQSARWLAERRCEEHRELGGGQIVTACAASLAAFRRAGADALDLVSIVRQLLEHEPTR